MPFEELHGDEELALVLADLVDLANVRVVDARRGSCLAPEAAPRRLVLRHGDHRLQRHRAMEPLVARGVDDAHAALSELAGDGVVAKPRRDALRGQWSAVGRGALGMRWRSWSFQPVVERAQRTLWTVVGGWAIGHRGLDGSYKGSGLDQLKT